MSMKRQQRIAKRDARIQAARAKANEQMRTGERIKAHLYSSLIDHGILRVLWTNFHPIAPGAFRSNQPSPARIARFARLGIKAVLNLRSETGLPFHRLESQACQQHGLQLWDVEHRFSARRAPHRQTLLAIVTALDAIPRPFVLHCKSGADRAGLVSALYLILFEGKTVKQAMGQLSLRYMHLRSTSTGIMDQVLRVYEREGEAQGISLRDWLEHHYDPDHISETFAAYRKGTWPPASPASAAEPRSSKAA